jgi:hypothetical protein
MPCSALACRPADRRRGQRDPVASFEPAVPVRLPPEHDLQSVTEFASGDPGTFSITHGLPVAFSASLTGGIGSGYFAATSGRSGSSGCAAGTAG